MATVGKYKYNEIKSKAISVPKINTNFDNLTSQQNYNSDINSTTEEVVENLDEFLNEYEKDSSTVENYDGSTINTSLNLEVTPMETEKDIPWYEKAWNTIKNTGATVAVGITTVASGIFDISEAAIDGLTWTSGKIVEGASWLTAEAVGLVNEDAKENILDWREDTKENFRGFIATDWVGKANEFFYENTDIGKNINDMSYMKYDSELANKIEGLTTSAGEIAVATAATILTGGAAAPFVCGAMVGIGNSAETMYQANPESSGLTELLILGTGALNGVAWAANGKLGASFVTEFGKSLGEIGLKDTFAKLAQSFVKPEFIKAWFKQSLTDAGNYISSAMMSAGDLIGFITGEKELTLENFALLGAGYIKNFGLNVLEDGVRLCLGGFKAPSTEALISLKNNPENIAEIQNRVGQVIKDELSSSQLRSQTDISAVLLSEGISEKTYNDITQDVKRITELKDMIRTSRDPLQLQSFSEEIEELNKRITNSGLTPNQLSKIIPIDSQVAINQIFLTDSQIEFINKYIENNPNMSYPINKTLNDGYISAGVLHFIISESEPTIENYFNLRNGSNNINNFWEELLKHINFEADGTLTSDLSEMSNLKTQVLQNVLSGLSDNPITSPLSETLITRILNGDLTDDLEFSYLYTYLNSKAVRFDDDSYTRCLDALSLAYQGGNSKYALKNMEYFSILNNISYSLEPGRAYVQGNDFLVLDSLVNSSGTVYHEFGHAIHHNLCEYQIPDDIEEIIERAKINATNNFDELYSLQAANKQRNDQICQFYSAEFEKMIIGNHGSVEKYKQTILEEIQAHLSKQEITQILYNSGMSNKTISEIVDNIDLQDSAVLDTLVESIYNQRRSTFIEPFEREGYGAPLSDIIAAIFQDNNVKINGIEIPITFAHDHEYFTKEGFNKPFAELMANINQLKLQNDTQVIDKLRHIFGDELFDKIDEVFALADR